MVQPILSMVTIGILTNFIFSVVGRSLFTAHFTDLFSANILLFRMLTGDPWSQIIPEPQAYPFIITYIVIARLVLINLFIAFSIEGFMSANTENDALVNA